MSCPDLSALARAGTPRADPMVVEHIRSCRSCWLDWQIQQGARYLHDPRIKATGDLDDRIIARAALAVRHSERPASWRLLAVAGLLVATAILYFLLVRPQVADPIPVVGAALSALASGVAAALYFRRRDEKECAPFTKDSSAERP